MFLPRIVRWLRAEARIERREKRWARWIGRSWARVSYGYWVEPTWLELNRFEVGIRDLPPAFDGLRIAHLTDFHCSHQVTATYLREAAALAQAQQPDLIVLTGDFVHKGHRYVETAAEALADLKAPLGVFAVLGNHDFSVRNALGWRRFRHLHRAVGDALQQRGIQVLRNEAAILRRGEEALHLVGVEDLWSRECDLERAYAVVPRSAPTLVLAHNPRTIEQLDGRRCDLMLSGHTHGGQVHLAGWGRPVLSKKARRFAAGLYRHEDAHLYVNKGVGFGFRFRYGVRPEVALVTLQVAERAP